MNMHRPALDVRSVAVALGGEVASPDSVLAPGPGHSPKDRSLSVKLAPDAPDGFTVYSHAKDDWKVCRDHVAAKLGRPAWEPKAKAHGAERRGPLAEYIYRDENGAPVLKVVRFPNKPDGSKNIRQMRWTGKEWEWGKPKGPKIPYLLPALLEYPDAPVFIVEGEKDADNLHRFGLIATTSSEGAGKWTPELARWFKGRRVYVLPDNDEAGRRHARQVLQNLHGTAAELRLVALPGLPERGDVSDWLKGCGKADELVVLCQAAPTSAPDSEAPSGEEEALAPAPHAFVWRDPATIAPRLWLYGFHLLRKQVSVTVAPGGVGKSSLTIVEALAMASGRDLLGDRPTGKHRVWLLNLEDPRDELDRRVIGAMLHHDVTPEEIDGRLFLETGRERPLCTVVQGRQGVEILRPLLDRFEEQIRARKIDVLVVDPFVSSHQVSENDNGAIDRVAKEWAALADRCNCAVELVHHTRKLNGEDGTSESGRGASALLGAARSGRVLNRMSEADREKAGLRDDQTTYFSVTRDKANLAPVRARVWRRMASVHLGNGDSVGVAEAWEWPDAFDGVTVADLLAVQKAIDGKQARYSDQAGDHWAGHIVAEVLGLNPEQDRTRIKRMIEDWLRSKALRKGSAQGPQRKPVPTMEVGEWAVV